MPFGDCVGLPRYRSFNFSFPERAIFAKLYDLQLEAYSYGSIRGYNSTTCEIFFGAEPVGFSFLDFFDVI